MINHPANSLVACLCAFLAAAALWLVVNLLIGIDNHRENRRNRRLDKASRREIRKQFNQIVNSQDGDQP